MAQSSTPYRLRNSISSLIKVAGHAIFAKLHVTVKPSESHESDLTEHQKFQYERKVKGQKQEDEARFPVTPDVPWTHGAATLWVSPCLPSFEFHMEKNPRSNLGLLVAYVFWLVKRRCNLMFSFWASQWRLAFVWERIGPASRILPATFSSTKRISIEILWCKASFYERCHLFHA